MPLELLHNTKAQAQQQHTPTRPDKSIFKMFQFLPPNVNGLVPDIPDVEELCNPATVSIMLLHKREIKRFRIPRVLICSHSAYFRAMFTNPVFEETTSQKVLIREQIPIWAFVTFVQWMFTQRLVLTGTQKTSIEELVEDGDAADPRSWPYTTLFHLYAMADFLDSLGMRRAIIQQVQIKMRSVKPKYLRPSHEDLVLLQQITPESSPLRRWIAFDIVVRCSKGKVDLLEEAGDEEAWDEEAGDEESGDEESEDGESLPEYGREDMVEVYSKLFEEAGDEESLAEFHRDINHIQEAMAEQRCCPTCGKDAEDDEEKWREIRWKHLCSKHPRIATHNMRHKWAATCMFHEHADASEYKLCQKHYLTWLRYTVADNLIFQDWPEFESAADEDEGDEGDTSCHESDDDYNDIDDYHTDKFVFRELQLRL